MPQVQFKMEADAARALMAMQKVIDKEAQLRSGQKKTTTQTKEWDGAMSQLGANSVQQLKGMLTGVLGVSGAVAGIGAAWRIANQELTRHRELQKELAAQSREMNRTVKDLANQLKIAGQPGGMDQARARITELMRAGGFADEASAASIGIAANVAWGGQANERQLASTVAGFAGARGLSADEASSLIEVMGHKGAGVAGVDDAKKRMAQVFAGFTKSKATSMSAYVTGLKKFMPETLAAGSSFEGALASFNLARNVTASSEEAAQRGLQMGRLLDDEKVRKSLAGQAGMTEMQFRGLPYDQQRAALGQWVSAGMASPEGQATLEKGGLTGRSFGFAKSVYGGGNFASRAGSLQEVQAATAARYDEQMAYYKSSVIGTLERREAETAIGEKVTSDELMLGKGLLDAGMTSYRRHKAGVQRRGDYDAPRYLLWGEEARGQVMTWLDLKQRGQAAQDAAVASGDLQLGVGGGGPGYRAYSPAGQAAANAFNYIHNIEPGVGDDLTADEAGRADMMLRRLGSNNVIVNNNYNAPGDPAQAGQAPVAVGD